MVPSLGLYHLNASAHGQLRTENPSITFQLGSASDSLNITVLYQAFDLQTTAPITQNGTSYFPLRCTEDTSFVLGRAFLQETYVLADYEMRNFSISQADFSGKKANIVSVNHGMATTTTAGSGAGGSNSGGLGKGAIAGIAVGASVAAILLLSFLFFFGRRRKVNNNNFKRASTLAPIPYDKSKGSYPSSSSSSQNPNDNSMTMSADQVAPSHRFEERLQRLERANVTRSPDVELPNSNHLEARKLPPPVRQSKVTWLRHYGGDCHDISTSFKTK